MRATPWKINLFLATKLPSAFLCGVRLKSINYEECCVNVRHRWINQNPFRSMYFAVQSMAGELSTGALLFSQIAESKQKISMLVVSNKATYFKKATGLVSFTCSGGRLVSDAIAQAISSGEGQTIVLKSVAKNDKEEIVSEMEFEWSIKCKPLNLP